MDVRRPAHKSCRTRHPGQRLEKVIAPELDIMGWRISAPTTE
jgi:hypothetical protein